MTRGIGATNITETDADSLYPVVLVKLGFATPVYLHSGIGDIVYSGNTYLGVGDLGTVESVRETESFSPSPITLTLSGLDSAFITEALNAGAYGDIITIYEGYRGTGNALKADPWLVARGFFETAAISLGKDNKITITMQHELVRLQEKPGRRYSNEDQQREYAGDTFFSFVASMANLKRLWGGREVAATGNSGSGDHANAPRDPNRR